jgi:hypothetical protein
MLLKQLSQLHQKLKYPFFSDVMKHHIPEEHKAQLHHGKHPETLKH